MNKHTVRTSILNYIEAFWNVINWNEVERRYIELVK